MGFSNSDTGANIYNRIITESIYTLAVYEFGFVQNTWIVCIFWEQYFRAFIFCVLCDSGNVYNCWRDCARMGLQRSSNKVSESLQIGPDKFAERAWKGPNKVHSGKGTAKVSERLWKGPRKVLERSHAQRYSIGKTPENSCKGSWKGQLITPSWPSLVQKCQWDLVQKSCIANGLLDLWYRSQYLQSHHHRVNLHLGSLSI